MQRLSSSKDQIKPCSVSRPGLRSEFLVGTAKPLSYFCLLVQPEIWRVAGGLSNFSRISRMVLWQTQARFLISTVCRRVADTFFSDRKSQVALSNLRLAIHQQILSAPSYKWTANSIPLTTLPQMRLHSLRCVCLGSY